MTLPRLPLTKALRTMLETGTGKPVGLGGYPRVTDPNSPDQWTAAELPFTVLYVVPGNVYSGPPFADDHADVEWVYQVNSVAARLDQAVWLLDRARRTVLGRADDPQDFEHPLDVPGMTVIRRRAVSDGTTDAEGDVVSLFEQYAFTVTGS